MRLCPKCQSVYADTEVFCWKDGSLLIEKINNPQISPNQAPTIPHFDGITPPSGYNPPPPTVQVGQSNIPPFNETVTLIQPSFTPPTQPPRIESNSNKNVIIAVLATASVFLLIGMLFLLINNYKISKELEVGSSSNTEREGNSGANNNSSSEDISSANSSQSDDRNSNKSEKEENDISTPEKKPDAISQSLPNGIEQQFSGSSRFPNKTLSLTLSLTRNGKSLSGAAITREDWDDLSGTIQPDGTFFLKGYNDRFGRVTGNWSGKISESGQISGTWISTIDGTRVPFSARRSR